MLYLTFMFIRNRKKIKGQQMQEDEFAKIINDIKTTRWMDWTGRGRLRQRRRPLDVLPASWSSCDSESEQVLMMLMMSFLFCLFVFLF